MSSKGSPFLSSESQSSGNVCIAVDVHFRAFQCVVTFVIFVIISVKTVFVVKSIQTERLSCSFFQCDTFVWVSSDTFADVQGDATKTASLALRSCVVLLLICLLSRLCIYLSFFLFFFSFFFTDPSFIYFCPFCCLHLRASTSMVF